MGPTEPMLTRAINVMHGHQVNLPTVQLLLDIMAHHNNRNGSFAFASFQAAHAQNDLTLVSITKSVNPGQHGHTLVAYKADDLGGGDKKIWVYDPSRSWAKPTCQPWYTTGRIIFRSTATGGASKRPVRPTRIARSRKPGRATLGVGATSSSCRFPSPGRTPVRPRHWETR